MEWTRFGSGRSCGPGDQVIFKLELIKMKAKLSKMSGKAYVDDQLVAEAQLMASLG